MAWCPKCKSEYVEGVTKCADCNCELVEEQELEPEKMSAWEEEVTLRAIALKKAEDAMKEGAFDEFGLGEADDCLADESEESADAEELRMAAEAMKAAFEFDEPEERPAYVTHYVNNEEKAEENKSSGYTLLIVGTMGLIFVILFFFDLLPIQLAVNKYMVSGVMGAMFVLFIVMGIVSMKNFKTFSQNAKKENNLTREIKKWCTESMTKEQIDASLSLEEEAEEIKYFKRTDKMKAMIQNQFMNLDESYLDRLIDEVYPEIFEDEKA